MPAVSSVSTPAAMSAGADAVAVAIDERRQHRRSRRSGESKRHHGTVGSRPRPRQHHAGEHEPRRGLRPRSLQGGEQGAAALAAAMMPISVTTNRHSTRL